MTTMQVDSLIDSYRELELLNDALKERSRQVSAREDQVKTILSAAETQWAAIQDERQRLQNWHESLSLREQGISSMEQSLRKEAEEEILATKAMYKRKLSSAKHGLEQKLRSESVLRERELEVEIAQLKDKVRAQAADILHLKRAKSKADQEALFQKRRLQLAVTERNDTQQSLSVCQGKVSKLEFERDSLRTKLKVFAWKRDRAETTKSEDVSEKASTKKIQTTSGTGIEIRNSDDPLIQYSWKSQLNLLDHALVHADKLQLRCEEKDENLSARKLLPGILGYVEHPLLMKQLVNSPDGGDVSMEQQISRRLLEFTFRCIFQLSEQAYRIVFHSSSTPVDPCKVSNWRRLSRAASTPSNQVNKLLHLMSNVGHENRSVHSSSQVDGVGIGNVQSQITESQNFESNMTGTEPFVAARPAGLEVTPVSTAQDQHCLLQAKSSSTRITSALIACECFILMWQPHGPSTYDIDALLNALRVLRHELTTAEGRSTVLQLHASRTLYSLTQYVFMSCPSKLAELVSACLLLLAQEGTHRKKFLFQIASHSWFISISVLSISTMKQLLTTVDLCGNPSTTFKENEASIVEVASVFSLLIDQIVHLKVSNTEGAAGLDTYKTAFRASEIGGLLRECLIELGFTSAGATPADAVQGHLVQLPLEVHLFARNALSILHAMS